MNENITPRCDLKDNNILQHVTKIHTRRPSELNLKLNCQKS